jgi:CRP-like cAMP-binding protein
MGGFRYAKHQPAEYAIIAWRKFARFDGMRATAEPAIRRLRGLKNISWLTPRQLNRLADALKMSRVVKRGIIFDKKNSPESAYVLLSGVAQISCRNRRGDRTMVIMVAPGMIPGIPPSAAGISYDFRCEAITDCRIGTVTLAIFIEIALGIGSAAFKSMAASYTGRWDLVQLRCSNFMACTLEERVALILLELTENFGVRGIQGIRLTVSPTHKDLADLVGASRPRVTEYLSSFERKHLIIRDGRQLIVRRDRLERFLARQQAATSRASSNTLA